jgi:hypothetical protein
MATGYEQVHTITAYLSGNEETFKRVKLDLPETGVCSINLVKSIKYMLLKKDC